MNNSPEFQWSKAEIPPRFQNWTWEMLTDISDLDKELAKEYVNNFPNNIKEGLYIYSKVSGTGKSTYAVCLLRDLIYSGKLKKTSIFKPFIHLMDTFREEILNGKALFNSDTFKRLQRSDIVILDDVGVERMNESIAQRYYMLVDYFWQYNKPVIYTSKFSVSELIDRALPTVETELLESIASRIKGSCSVIELDNKRDFRATT